MRANASPEEVIAKNAEDRPGWVTDYNKQYEGSYKEYITEAGRIGNCFIFGDGFNDGYRAKEDGVSIKPIKVCIGLDAEPTDSYYRAFIKKEGLEFRGWFYELGWNEGYQIKEE